MLLMLPLVVITTLLLPPWFCLVFSIPVVKVLTGYLNIPPILSIGGADIGIEDIILLGVAFKILTLWLLQKWEFGHSLYIPASVYFFLLTITCATLVSYYRFEESVFLSEITALFRFFAQASAYFLLTLSFRNIRQVEWSYQCIYTIGYLAASIIYLNMILQPFGITIGQINVSEEYVRYQGIIGDSVKLFLLPFIFVEVMAAHFLSAFFFAGALLATGGRVGFVGVLVGLGVIFLGKKHCDFEKLLVFMVFIFLIGGAFWLNIGGIETRFTSPEELYAGFGNRWATWNVALQLFLDNLFTGVGYGGYRFFCMDYLFYSYYYPFTTETFSQLLKVGVDAGIIGVIIFLWMMWSVLKTFRTAILLSEGEQRLSSFLEGSYIWVLTLFILSPFVAWLLAASDVGYLFWMFLGMATVILGLDRSADQVWGEEAA